MGNIVELRPRMTDGQRIIDVSKVSTSTSRLDSSLIKPATEEVNVKIAEEHASDPIKNIEDIEKVSSYLKQHGRYRDNMLFIVGINFGLRVSDLIQLRFSQLINDDLTFKTTFPVLEKKTSNTRKVAKNRYITINEAVTEAVILYLQNETRRQVSLSDYMFRSESNRGINQNKPMTRMSVDRILKEVAKAVGLKGHIATHTLRKTFGYHQMVMSGNDPRKLLVLQKMFGHSTSMQTLDYIGITGEEVQEAYANLNLGSRNCYQRFGQIGELNLVS